MKIEHSITLLCPTVSYGNVSLTSKVSMDTVTDLGRVEELQKQFKIRGDKTSSDTVAEVCRKMCEQEIKNQKAAIDQLSVESFRMPQPMK